MFLSFTSNSGVTSVGLFNEDGSIVQIENATDGNKTEEIPVLLNTILVTQNINISDISGIVLSVGPGSFTATRTICAYVSGLISLTSIPFIPVNNFDLMIALLGFSSDSTHQSGTWTLAIPYKGNEYYTRTVSMPSCEIKTEEVFDFVNNNDFARYKAEEFQGIAILCNTELSETFLQLKESTSIQILPLTLTAQILIKNILYVNNVDKKISKNIAKHANLLEYLSKKWQWKQNCAIEPFYMAEPTIGHTKNFSTFSKI